MAKMRLCIAWRCLMLDLLMKNLSMYTKVMCAHLRYLDGGNKVVYMILIGKEMEAGPCKFA